MKNQLHSSWINQYMWEIYCWKENGNTFGLLLAILKPIPDHEASIYWLMLQHCVGIPVNLMNYIYKKSGTKQNKTKKLEVIFLPLPVVRKAIPRLTGM